MKKNEGSVTIRFAMTKGQGDYPEGKEFNAEEIADIRNSSHFYLVYDPESSDEDLSDLIIEECIVIYDGVTHSEDLKCGLHFEKGSLCGWPTPIIKFKLSRQIDPEVFKQCVWTSGYVVCPASRDEKDEEPFVFEDQNGYTSVLNANEIKELVETLKKHNLMSGKIFSKDEMENGVFCLEMAPN